MTQRGILMLVLFTSLGCSVEAQLTPFMFSDKMIVPGNKFSIQLSVLAAKDTSVIPVMVFHGVRKGPVFGIIDGIHGYEYVPVIAAQNFSQELNAQDLSSTIILVHVANLPDFPGIIQYRAYPVTLLL
jgi:predicted deacylase